MAVEESRKVLGAINTTFLAMINKKDDHRILDEFGPISLCSVEYKIISKVIEIILKLVLYSMILGTIWVPEW